MTGKNQSTIEIYTDGGGELSGAAASAAILRRGSSGDARCFVMFLGGGTNNEAEISGILLALSALHALQLDTKSGIDWYADSEYTLKSATQWIFGWQRNGWRTSDKKPVKNQGLWRCYLELAAKLPIKPHHVRGHTGHRENELCDSACNWAKYNSVDVLNGRLSAAAVLPDGDQWLVVDGRDFIQRMREDLLLSADDYRMLVPLLSGVEVGANRTPTKSPAKSETSNLTSILQQVDLLAEQSEKLGGRGVDLGRDLRQVAKKFGK